MDIEHVQGDSFILDVEFTNDDTGTPINITGATITFSVKECKEDVTYIKQITATIVDGPNWLAKFQDLATFNIAIGEYFFDIQVVDSLGVKSTPVRGLLNVVYEITTS